MALLFSSVTCRRATLIFSGLLSRHRPANFIAHIQHKADSRLILRYSIVGFHTTVRRLQQQQKKPNFSDKDLRNLLVVVCIALTVAVVESRRRSGQDKVATSVVTWKEFVGEMLAKGEVEKIIVSPPSTQVLIQLHRGAVVKGRETHGPFPAFYKMNIGSLASFENNLRKAERDLGIPADQSVTVVYNRITAMSLVVFYGIIGLGLYFLFKKFKGSKSASSMFSGMFDSFRKANFRVVDPSFRVNENLQVKFSDVLGLQEAKVEIKEFVDYLKVPEKYTKLGAKLPKGALLLGPPGCGKTLLAKAVASEANVPFLATNGPEFIEMIGGLGAARVRDLFKQAKLRAPCMIYIDEIDAIGRNRSGGGTGAGGGGTSEQEQTLNQLLVEMDGMDSAKGVVVLASTNRSDILDKALLRRGRFDRHVTIDLPTLAERQEIFEYYLKKIVLENASKNYAIPLAKMTPGFTGADIANVCNESALKAASEDKAAVSELHLNQALDRVLTGAEKRSRTVPPEDKEIVAFHECGHALVGWMLKHTNALLKVTIIPRTATALGFAQYEPQDKKIYFQEELADRMCMLMGGRAAEILVFNQPVSGAQNDLERATKLAYDQVKFYGMSKAVGPISFAPLPDAEEYIFDKPYGKKLAALIDLEANGLVTTAYQRAEEILRQNRDKLDLLAKTLLKNETLTYNEMTSLIGPPPHGPKKPVETVDLDLPGPIPDAVEPTSKDAKSSTENSAP